MHLHVSAKQLRAVLVSITAMLTAIDATIASSGVHVPLELHVAVAAIAALAVGQHLPTPSGVDSASE